MTNTKLTPEQLELGAMYFASSNTGLIGCGHEMPKSVRDIRGTYAQISYDYENELGEGLEGELSMWKQNLQNDTGDWEERLKEEIPFIFEEVA